MIFLTSNDPLDLMPIVNSQRPIVFAAISSPAWLNAYTKLIKHHTVSHLYLFDANQAQLVFAQRMVKLLRRHRLPKPYLEALFGTIIPLDSNGKPGWEFVDTEAIAETVPGLERCRVELSPGDNEHKLVYFPGPRVQFLVDTLSESASYFRPRRNRTESTVGFGSGAFNGRPLPDLPAYIEYLPGRMTHVVTALAQKHCDQTMIIWCSNAAGYPPRLVVDPGLTPDWVKQLDGKHPNLWFWLSHETQQQARRDFLTKPYDFNSDVVFRPRIQPGRKLI